MKAVTIARITRILIAVVVAIVLAIPVYGGLQSFQLGGTNFVEADSVYPMEYMTESNLNSNINTVIGDKTGYSVVYDNKIVPVDKSNLAAVVHEVKTSTAETATLLDPNGKICTQQTIIGSKGMSQYLFTALKLSSGLVKAVTPTIAINAITDSGTYKISNVDVTSSGDTFKLGIELPMVALAEAAALKSQISLDVGIEYNQFFTANIQMSIPAETFIPKGSMPTYTASTDGKTVDIHTNMSMPQDITASVGDVSISVTKAGDVKIQSVDKSIVDSLKASLEKDGKLILNVEGKDPIVIEKSTAETVIKLADELIKKGAKS